MRLTRDPKIVQLARDLHLDLRGDCARRITAFALDRVRSLLDGFECQNLDLLRLLLANRLRAKVEFILNDSDVGRIAAEHAAFHPLLLARLREEFLMDSTEGITLARESGDGKAYQFLAVVDARGYREVRAYFTAWHELVHLLIHPPQLTFPGFRRTQSEELRSKDPIESLVDSIAGHVGFYEPLYGPVLRRTVSEAGRVSFQALNAARIAAAPSASFFAAAVASMRLTTQPALLVSVEVRLKKSEARRAASGQFEISLGINGPAPQLRVVSAVPSANGNSAIQIFSGMRVPGHSVINAAFNSETDVTLEANENQDWWETSANGPLPSLALRVDAVRRGRFVYGLVTFAS
jgi:hypothetical protein